jgi:tRNA threonylcarbamoyladenosine biosynthesis protein TsaE
MLYHFDFYRFQDESEWEEAGFRDLFTEQAIKLVEWSSKAENVLPRPDMTIKIHIDNNFTDEYQNKSFRMVDLACFSKIGHQLIS